MPGRTKERHESLSHNDSAVHEIQVGTSECKSEAPLLDPYFTSSRVSSSRVVFKVFSKTETTHFHFQKIMMAITCSDL